MFLNDVVKILLPLRNDLKRPGILLLNITFLILLLYSNFGDGNPRLPSLLNIRITFWILDQ